MGIWDMGIWDMGIWDMGYVDVDVDMDMDMEMGGSCGEVERAVRFKRIL